MPALLALALGCSALSEKEIVDLSGAGGPCAAGEVRVCYSGPPQTLGLGRCVAGTETCAAGRWTGRCEGEVVPGPETCNALDDDCDRAADEEADCSLPDVVVHDCPAQVVSEPFEAVVVEMAWPQEPPAAYEGHTHVRATPAVANVVEELDEIVPEVAVLTFAEGMWGIAELAVLRLFSGRGHEVLWTDAGRGNPDDALAEPALQGDVAPGLGDLDGDGLSEIVVARADAILAYRGDGTLLWETTLAMEEISTQGAIAVADLEGDGTAEAIVGRTVIAGDGDVRWTGAWGAGPLTCVADVDGEGTLEVIAGDTAYRADGSVLWRLDPREHGSGGSCAVGDVVRGGAPEVVRTYVEPFGFASVQVLSGPDGVSAGDWPHPGVGRIAGAPTIADLDADGSMEIAAAAEQVLWVRDMTSARWQRPVADAFFLAPGSGAASAFDFDGDGASEVVFADEDAVRVHAGGDGAVLWEAPAPTARSIEEPVVADVDGDGNAEILVGSDSGIRIWGSGDDSWAYARRDWTGHAYGAGDGTFRAQAIGPDGDRWPDLAAADAPFDPSRCHEGILRVCAAVQNAGEFFVAPGVRVEFADGTPKDGGVVFASGETTRTLDPGEQEMVCADWPGAPMAPAEVWVTVDPGGAVRECDEANVFHLHAGGCGGVE